MRLRAVFGLIVVLAIGAEPAMAAGLDGWAAVVVAGDNESAHVDTPTLAFDNARRDIGVALEAEGLPASRLAEFSVDPSHFTDPKPGRSNLLAIGATLGRLAAAAPAGCLFYLTSHGSPDGVVIGDRLIAPKALAQAFNAACAGKPAIVVISACFSGVFVPALRAPDRLVITAARRDRSSFGCGESDRYPYFDGCVLQSLPRAADFVALANRARACVARRERQEHMVPASEPQIALGPRFVSPRLRPYAR